MTALHWTGFHRVFAAAFGVAAMALSTEVATARSAAGAAAPTDPAGADMVIPAERGDDQGVIRVAAADGPDFWVVFGVPAGDALNIRSGAGTGYGVLARAPNGVVLRNLGCRGSASSRWCQVESRDGTVRGWVSGRYLRESGGGGTVGSGSSSVPELAVRSGGEIEVRWASGCTMLYSALGKRILAGGTCSTMQRSRSDDAVARHLREQDGSMAAGGGGSGRAFDMRGYGRVTAGGSATGHITSHSGRTYAVIISAAQDGFTCTGSFDKAPGHHAMTTPIHCTNGASGTAILGEKRSNGYLLTFSTSSHAGGYVQFRR